MAHSPLGVGIIGSGFGASVHLPGFMQVSDCRVLGIASKDPEKSKTLAEKHGLSKSYGSPEELIRDPDVQLVSIASPQFTHAKLVAMAIDAGKHVLCEKPFGLNAKEARALLKQATDAGIVHALDFEFRELPAWKLLHQCVQERRVGDIQRADLRWVVGTWADAQRPWKWQCDAAQGGGVISALGVHLLDAAEWMLGPMESVQANIGTKIGKRPLGDGFKECTSDDHATIELKGEDGIVVNITLSNVDPNGPGLVMEFFGEHGTLLLDNPGKEYGRGMRVRQIIGNGEPELLPCDDVPPGMDPRIAPFQWLAERLIHAIRDGVPFRPGFEEGLQTTILRDAILQSAKTGGWTDI